MGRRVFLSVLGVAFYETCRYRKDDFTGSETLFCAEEFTRISTAAGELGRRKPPGSYAPDRFGKEEQLGQESGDPFLCQLQNEVAYQGLEKILQDMNLSYLDIAIPDGKDSEQMWEIFEVIFDELQEGDELYLDITNSFRYLPMLLVVLVNYAKLLKNVKVKRHLLWQLRGS